MRYVVLGMVLLSTATAQGAIKLTQIQCKSSDGDHASIMLGQDERGLIANKGSFVLFRKGGESGSLTSFQSVGWGVVRKGEEQAFLGAASADRFLVRAVNPISDDVVTGFSEAVLYSTDWADANGKLKPAFNAQLRSRSLTVVLTTGHIQSGLIGAQSPQQFKSSNDLDKSLSMTCVSSVL